MRTIRLDIETREKSFLSPAASFSSNSKGCQQPREEDDIRTLYMQTETESYIANILED